MCPTCILRVNIVRFAWLTDENSAVNLFPNGTIVSRFGTAPPYTTLPSQRLGQHDL